MLVPSDEYFSDPNARNTDASARSLEFLTGCEDYPIGYRSVRPFGT